MSRISPTLRAWALTLASVVLVVAVIGAFGGFRERDPKTIAADVGDPVTLTRWDAAVDGCEVEFEDEGGRLWLFMTLTNTGSETSTGISNAVGIRTPGGERFGARDELMTTTNMDSGGGFDPGFAAGAMLRAYFEQQWDPMEPIRVTLHDEVNSDGYLLTGRWGTGAPVAVVDVVCTVIGVDE